MIRRLKCKQTRIIGNSLFIPVKPTHNEMQKSESLKSIRQISVYAKHGVRI